jgi:hypothetical protein
MRSLAAVLLLVALGLPLPALAYQATAEDLRLPKTVALLPLKDYSGPAEYLFRPEMRNPTRAKADELLGVFARALEEGAPVKLLKGAELRRRATQRKGYNEQLELARERYDLGRDAFLALRQEEASRHLERASQLLRAVFGGLSEQELTATVMELHGVALVELGLHGQAHMVFRMLFEFQPERRFAPSYYPEAVQKALVSAYNDVQTSAAQGRSFAGGAVAVNFRRELKLDAILVPVLLQREGGPTLEIIALGGEQAFVEWVGVIPLGDEARPQASAAAYRWLSCTTFAQRKLPPKDLHGRHLLAASFQQIIFPQTPTRDPIFAPGAAMDYAYHISGPLSLALRTQVFSSLQDQSRRDLVKGFSGIQTDLGVTLAWGGRWWQAYTGFAAAIQVLGTFTTSKDPDCKFFPEGSAAYQERCGAGDIKRWPSETSVGAEARLGFRLYPSRRLFLDTGVSFTMLAWPFDRFIELNFPMAASIGVGTVL